jgi:site-specific DNA-cytosine methylase
MRGYLEASDAKRKGTARRAKGGSGADGLEGTIGTLCADSHPGAYSGQDVYTGRLIPQAFGGNNTSGSIQVATALTAHGGPHGRQDFASETFIAQPFTASSFAQYQEGVGTLRANGGDLGGGSETLAVQPIPIHDQATRFAGKRGDKQDGKGNGLGVGKPGDPCPTLTRGDHHAVAIPYRKAKRAQSDKDDETWVEADQSNTLNNFDLGDTRTTHAVVEPIPLDMRNAGRDPEKKDEMNRQGLGVGNPGDPSHTITSAFVNGVAHEQKLYENHPNDSRVTGPLEVAPTVVSRFGTGGGNIPFVHPAENVVSPTVTTCKGSRGGCSSEAIDEITAIHQAQGVAPIAFQPGNLRRKGGADPSETTFPTLKCDAGDQSPHVAVSFDTYNQSLSDTSQAIRSAASDVDHVGAVFQPSMAVRRLSVRECERLQGFPDDWSLIPWKGKPLSECPDGPRYKACGNSMAVPVMRHLGKAIDAMDKKLKGNS